MNAVYNDYTPKNVKFLFVNANRSEPASEVREHAKSVGFTFPVYKDANNVLADRFDAQVTPESYVIDSAGIIRYHGSIDDSQTEDAYGNADCGWRWMRSCRQASGSNRDQGVRMYH